MPMQMGSAYETQAVPTMPMQMGSAYETQAVPTMPAVVGGDAMQAYPAMGEAGFVAEPIPVLS
jgi:hypothetical protein